MKGELPGDWPQNNLEDTDSDDSDEASTNEPKPGRGVALGRLFVGGRGGMGAESRNRDREQPSRPLGAFMIGGRPDQGVDSTVINLSKKREERQEAAEGLAGEKHVLPEDQVRTSIRAEAIEQTARQPLAEPELRYATAPAEALPAKLTSETEEETPESAEDALVVWLREEREQEKRPFEGWLYGGEVVTKPAADLTEERPVPAPVPEAALDQTGELTPTPVAAEMEDETVIAPAPLRLVHSAGNSSPRQPRQRRSQAHLTLVPPVGANNTLPVSPNAQQFGLNNVNTLNPPSNPNAPPLAGNMNIPPSPGVLPFGGGPGGPGGPPFSPGINPNRSGSWNPAQSWRQTAPEQTLESSSRGAGTFLLGVLTGRYLLGGRRKLKRQMREGFKERDRKAARVEADHQVAQAEQRKQQTLAASEQARLNRELASTQQRLGGVEERNKTLETDQDRIRQEMDIASRRTEEQAKADEETGRTVKAEAMRRFRSARARLKRFNEAAEQSEVATGDLERLAAQKGDKLVLDGSGWVAYDVDSQGHVVDEAESVVKHGPGYDQERAVEMGVAAKSQPADEVAQIALLGTVSSATTGKRRPEAGVRGGDGGSLPYLPGAASGPAQYPGLPGPQSPVPYAGKAGYESPIKQKQATGPLWPYLLALAVISICLVVLLH